MSCSVQEAWFQMEYEMDDKRKVKFKDFLTKVNEFKLRCEASESTFDVKKKSPNIWSALNILKI